MKTVLIVDDDKPFADGLARILRMQGHDVRIAGDLAVATDALTESIPQLLVLDLMLPDGSGLALLEHIKDQEPEHIAFVTGQAAVMSFVRSVAGPAVSYLTKPVEPATILQLVDSLEEEPGTGTKHFGALIGDSAAMELVYEQVRRVAPTDSTVFIEGESGTGKELVAQAIHYESERPGKFVPVNCGGLTRELIASELFGHEKGSFTGAARKHAGYFERAAGGTLFLDEVTEMPMDMQTQLLRVLETGRYSRVGSEQELQSDARLIAATNRNPIEAVREGKLREDLYFRLQVFPVVVPPLRERMADLPVLAEHFLDELNQRNKTNKLFADGVIASLTTRPWPGNVRELKHAIQQAYIMSSDDEISLPDTPESPLLVNERETVGRSIKDVEKELIMATLEHFDGDKKAAAEILGVSLKTLYNRLKDYEESV